MKKKQKPDDGSSHVNGEISGLPTSLVPGTLAALVENGNSIALASGDLLTVFRITRGAGRTAAREVACYSLPGRVRAIAESNVGIVVAVDTIHSVEPRRCNALRPSLIGVLQRAALAADRIFVAHTASRLRPDGAQQIAGRLGPRPYRPASVRYVNAVP